MLSLPDSRPLQAYLRRCLSQRVRWPTMPLKCLTGRLQYRVEGTVAFGQAAYPIASSPSQKLWQTFRDRFCHGCRASEVPVGGPSLYFVVWRMRPSPPSLGHRAPSTVARQPSNRSDSCGLVLNGTEGQA
jgi:hypothetical protein